LVDLPTQISDALGVPTHLCDGLGSLSAELGGNYIGDGGDGSALAYESVRLFLELDLDRTLCLVPARDVNPLLNFRRKEADVEDRLPAYLAPLLLELG